MNYAILDETTLLKTLRDTITKIGIPVFFENPDSEAAFPCIVMQSPLSRPIYMGAAWGISVTLEVWGNQYFDPLGKTKETADYFTELKSIMLSLNFQCANQIPAFTDIMIHKIRMGGYFESRWNSITNEFERRN
jgi:hypothetical protein